MKTQHGAGVATSVESHRLYFDGVGSEYFRIWLGNLLLGIVTLGLYTPWARRRNAQYFVGGIEVAGCRLAFTLPLWCLALGAALLLGLGGAFELALRTGQTQTLLMVGLGVLVLLPWAWGSATRERLDHTRWQGLSLRLRASWGEIYAAAWPLFALALLWAGVGLVLAALGPDVFLREGGARAATVAGLLVLGGVLTPLWLARLRFNWGRLTVQRAQVGAEAGHWTLDFSPFLRIALASLGVFALSLAAVAACGALANHLGLLPRWHGGTVQDAPWVLAVPLLGVLLFVPALAYHDARTFQLVWNHIGMGRFARVRCTLRTRAYFWLRLRNAIFSALTLGLCLPFSRVQRWRMKTLSVTLFLRGDADELAEALARQHAALFGRPAAQAHRLELLSAATAGATTH